MIISGNIHRFLAGSVTFRMLMESNFLTWTLDDVKRIIHSLWICWIIALAILTWGVIRHHTDSELRIWQVKSSLMSDPTAE